METESALQREIRQSRPFRSKGQEAMLGLLRTADLVRRSISRVLEPHDITPQQYNVLRILRGAGETGLPTLEIAERMLEQTPGITRLIDRLEAKGLVARQRCAADRRQVLCWLTPAGSVLVARLDGPMDEADEAVAAVLPAKDLERLIGLLDTLRARWPESPSET